MSPFFLASHRTGTGQWLASHRTGTGQWLLTKIMLNLREISFNTTRGMNVFYQEVHISA